MKPVIYTLTTINNIFHVTLNLHKEDHVTVSCKGAY